MANVWKIPEALAHRYHGAGPGLVAVTGGQVVALVYLEDKALSDDRLDETVRELQAQGAVSVVMLIGWEALEL